MHIEDNYLVLDNEYLKPNKKLAGHSFVGLIGYDKFKPVGDTLLGMFGLVKEQIDPKWLKRGDYAESIVKYVYTREGHICTTYDKKQVNYDNFQEYQNCGGLIDIELLDEQTLIEVKSKNVKDYDFIKETPPAQEVYQGLYYGYLRHYKKITMEWIFFDTETENEIFNDVKPTSLQGLKRHSLEIDVNDTEMHDLIKTALSVVATFKRDRKISIDLISDKYLQMLGFDRTQTNKAMETLPF